MSILVGSETRLTTFSLTFCRSVSRSKPFFVGDCQAPWAVCALAEETTNGASVRSNASMSETRMLRSPGTF